MHQSSQVGKKLSESPPQPLLIIVTGPPAGGKTTLARRLSTDLHLPLACRDDFKEVLFDTLGWSDRAWSRRLGAASWELLYHAITVQLSAGQSLIAESNFRHDLAAERIGALLSRYSAGLLQVVCTADPETLIQRYRARTENGQRHPGHVDDLETTQAEFSAALAAGYDWSVSHDTGTHLVDTTNPASIDYDTLVAACQASILRSR